MVYQLLSGGEGVREAGWEEHCWGQAGRKVTAWSRRRDQLDTTPLRGGARRTCSVEK